MIGQRLVGATHPGRTLRGTFRFAKGGDVPDVIGQTSADECGVPGLRQPRFLPVPTLSCSRSSIFAGPETRKAEHLTLNLTALLKPLQLNCQETDRTPFSDGKEIKNGPPRLNVRDLHPYIYLIAFSKLFLLHLTKWLS